MLDQFGIGVQGHQFRLEQVLRHHETGEVGLGFERSVGFDEGIKLGVWRVGDLVQALGAQVWAFCGSCSGHGKVLEKGSALLLLKRAVIK